MRKIFCDICGKEIEDGIPQIITVKVGSREFEYETCRSCFGKNSYSDVTNGPEKERLLYERFAKLLGIEAV